jgi:hypothetical protein
MESRMSVKNMRFCIFCGQPLAHDKSGDECAHSYNPPSQILIPCRALYHDADWLLYTVDNEIKSVYINKQDFSEKHSPIGSGGIVLRDPQIIFKSWELKSVESIVQFLSQEQNINSSVTLEIITLLWHINDLFIGQSSIWSIDDLYFQNNCPQLPLVRISNFVDLIDKYGDLEMSKILNYVYLHGRFEAKVQF